MSAFPNSKVPGLLSSVSLVLLMASSAADATIVLDGRASFTDSRGQVPMRYPAYSATGYAIARSHAWMKYERGSGTGAAGLVAVPYAGALSATTSREASLRSNLARAQSYRIGGRW